MSKVVYSGVSADGLPLPLLVLKTLQMRELLCILLIHRIREHTAPFLPFCSYTISLKLSGKKSFETKICGPDHQMPYLIRYSMNLTLGKVLKQLHLKKYYVKALRSRIVFSVFGRDPSSGHSIIVTGVKHSAFQGEFIFSVGSVLNYGCT